MPTSSAAVSMRAANRRCSRTRRLAAVFCACLPLAACAASTATSTATQTASASPPADAIETPLSATPGDAVRGRAIVANRQVGLCLLCHRGPIPEERFQGTLAPDLAGAGARWSAAQLRLRIVDSHRLNPDSLMPAYYRAEGLTRVGKAWQGKTLFDAQQVEDVLAYLETLR